MAETAHDLSFLDQAIPIRDVPDGQPPDTWWTINNSSIYKYSNAVFPGYPRGLMDIIRKHVGYADDNVGIDLAGGSRGIAICDLIYMGHLAKGLVTNYNDFRPESVRAAAKFDHQEGELLSHVAWQGLITWQQQQAPNGLALVMHRPAGGLQGQPVSVYRGAAHVLLDLIRPGGVFYSQIPAPILGGREGWSTLYRELRRHSDVAQVLVDMQPPLPYDKSVVIIKKPE